MIRFVHCVKALPELPAADFRRYLRGDELARLMDQMALLSQAVEYKISLTLQIEANLGLMQERGGAQPFDALIEVWWESGQNLMQQARAAEFQDLMRQMEDFQRQFVDFSRSSRFFVEE
jgi:hypothetical protein